MHAARCFPDGSGTALARAEADPSSAGHGQEGAGCSGVLMSDPALGHEGELGLGCLVPHPGARHGWHGAQEEPGRVQGWKS